MRPHIPGPWHVHPKWTTHVLSNSETKVAIADTTFYRVEDAEANARLIAAAPELLKALKEAKEFIETQQRPDAEWSRVLDLSVAAIARATGGAE